MKSLSLLDELVEFGTLTAPVQPTLPKEWTNTPLIRWMYPDGTAISEWPLQYIFLFEVNGI